MNTQVLTINIRKRKENGRGFLPEIINKPEAEYFENKNIPLTKSEFIEKISTTSNGRPWVFYVHGFNKNFNSAKKQALKLANLHDVNVIIFSWPSAPYSRIVWIKKLGQNVFKLLKIGASKKYMKVGAKLTSLLANKIKYYKKAQNKALQSSPYLQKVLPIVLESMNGKKTFISHSMGNYIVEHLADYNDLRKFDLICLHQADVDAEKAKEVWIDKINRQNDVIVTINEDDPALFNSDIINTDISQLHRSALKNKRLGNVKDQTSESSPTYLNLTKEATLFNKGGGHTLFLSTKKSIYKHFALIFQ